MPQQLRAPLAAKRWPALLFGLLAGALLWLGGGGSPRVAAQAPPTIVSITPNFGSATGGTHVTITGTNFKTVSGQTRFEFNFSSDEAFTNVQCTSPTSCTATSAPFPNSRPGQNPYVARIIPVVNGVRGDSPVDCLSTPFPPQCFIWYPTPVIDSINPTSGAAAGGTQVTIDGGFFPFPFEDLPGTVSTVRFGDLPATTANCLVGGGFSCTATAPAGIGTVQVTIETPGGVSNGVPFTYVSPPTISSITPNFGPGTGGTNVTITGTNFSTVPGETRFAFRDFTGDAFTNVQCASTTSCTATSAPHRAVGPGTPPYYQAITAVVNGLSSSSSVDCLDEPQSAPCFAWWGAPRLDSISPTSGPAAGGTVVTIAGFRFPTMAESPHVPVPTVRFGATPATDISCVDAFTCTATTPPGSGTVPVTIETPGGVSPSAPFIYEGQPAPAITSFTPNSGPVTGGTTVTITGTNFVTGAGGTSVSFGSTAATNVSCSSPTSCQATSPASAAAGSVPVTVTTAGGTSNALPYTYIQPLPTITSISPTTGPEAGDTAVVITGTHLAADTNGDGIVEPPIIRFGTTPATGVTCAGTTQCTAVSPPGTGTVPVTASTAGGTSTGVAYRYVPAPAVSAVSPSAGPTSGGTPVTITGSGFQTGANVRFGDAPATGVTVDSATQIRVTTPAHAAGSVTVSVTNPDGQTGTRQNAFTYTRRAPTIHHILPTAGPASGGTLVTIVGSDFGLGAEVYFGSTRAALPVCALLLCVVFSPSETGTVPVTVRTAAGTSNGVPFTYTGRSTGAAPSSAPASSPAPSPTPTPSAAPSPVLPLILP